MVQVNFGDEPKIILFQPEQSSGVFQRYRGYARNTGHKFQMVAVKPRTLAARIQVNATDNFLKRFIINSKVISGRVGNLLYDTGKSAVKIASATILAKLIVDGSDSNTCT